MAGIQAVIFDLGGVILRTLDIRPRAALARRYGLSTNALDQIVFHNAAAQAAERGQATEAEVWQEVGRLLNAPDEALPEIAEQFFAGDRIDFALVDYIRGLRPGRVTAVLSNSWIADLGRSLREKWQIPADAFDVVVSSARVGLVKPDPRIYQLALEQVQAAPEETIFVDDSLPNVAGAAALGIHAIRYFNTPGVIAEIERAFAEGDGHR